VGKRSGVIGWTLEELDLPNHFGCRVVALERMGQAIAIPDPKTVVQADDVLALIGSPKGTEAFSMRYERRKSLKWKLKILPLIK
jgi:uncharacterized protein with PhoU and TrkA domain